jgi:hypothetical protein
MQLFDENAKDHAITGYTLEFSFEFVREGDQISFALMPAYSYDDLQYDSFVWSMLLKKEKTL